MKMIAVISLPAAVVDRTGGNQKRAGNAPALFRCVGPQVRISVSCVGRLWFATRTAFRARWKPILRSEFWQPGSLPYVLSFGQAGSLPSGQRRRPTGTAVRRFHLDRVAPAADVDRSAKPDQPRGRPGPDGARGAGTQPGTAQDEEPDDDGDRVTLLHQNSPRGITLTREDAEDAVQDAFLHAYRALDRFRPELSRIVGLTHERFLLELQESA